MSTNPLFPSADGQSDDTPQTNENAAVELIRAKVQRAYANEPEATKELTEATVARTPSKHQLYMKQLSASGKSLAEIQTAWHHYYTMLPDTEKHEVWQEFYAANQNTPYQRLFQKQYSNTPTVKQATERPAPESMVSPVQVPTPNPSGSVVADHEAYVKQFQPDRKAISKIKTRVLERVSANGKLRVKHHIQSLLFGFGMGFLVLAIFLFSFFNEYIIAPFIQPSRSVSATPIILSDAASLASANPQVIIPKINVQIPLDFSVANDNENAIENALQSGVVHYPSTVLPGQTGNTAFFGHSSNNIFNPGKYKFAFVLLHTLNTGDTFYITYSGKAYAYQVFAREIVDPSDVSVLTDTKGKTSTATLITCDPPGTSLHRLVVWGQQISPDPSANTQTPTTTITAAAPKHLASNGPTLWSRFVGWLEFWH